MAKTPVKLFYVYRIFGEMGETVYIVKGMGRRFANQKRRFMSDGEIMEWLGGLETSVRDFLMAMINDIANKQGQANFVAGLRSYGIEVIDG
jgi:hypothetical protein